MDLFRVLPEHCSLEVGHTVVGRMEPEQAKDGSFQSAEDALFLGGHERERCEQRNVTILATRMKMHFITKDSGS